MKTISKSSYCSGLQCPKILWMKTHRKEDAKISQSTQNVFNKGHEVGDYAKHYFGDFLEVRVDFHNLSESLNPAIELTKTLINRKTPTICEATFKYEKALCLSDIVRVNSDGSLHVIEVKQGANEKQEYLNDMAFQYYVIKKCGYTISKISLMLIDTSYVRQGEIEPQKLFKIIDCTEKILAMQDGISEKIEEFIRYSEQKEEPEMAVGSHCSKPYACAYFEHCHKGVDVKEEEGKMGGENFNKEGIQFFLDGLNYPLYFFDFETTLQEPIPLVDGASPYKGTPYQYSLHIQKSKDENIEKLEHREFLAEELTNETVRELAEQLCKDIPKDATVIAWSVGFERGVVERLANTFPDLSEHLMAIHGNFVDLMRPFKSKYLRTPEMQDSASLKKVLPALLPEFRYSDLDVQDGSMAYDAFKSLPNSSPEKREQTLQAMRDYCRLDTFAMVRILRKLERFCE